MVTLADIHAAAARIAGTAVRTPLVRLDPARLSAFGLKPTAEIYLKDESAQPIGSFKLRGAYNKIAQLAPDELRRGVITYSSGNHAQGVAYAARALGAKAVIVMPSNAPAIKRAATLALGADVVTVGPASSERRLRAEELAAMHGYTIIPPYDDPAIIAGQATCGLEILEQLPDVDLVLSPVSGGGLLSGVATAIKLGYPEALASGYIGNDEKVGFSPGGNSPQVWGCEPELAADAKQSFNTKQLTEWPAVFTSRTICDGLRTQSLGQLNFAHIVQHVDGIVTVSEAEILLATRIFLAATDITAEPSGAITLAAALFHAHELPQAQRIVVIVSGGNLEPALRNELEEQWLVVGEEGKSKSKSKGGFPSGMTNKKMTNHCLMRPLPLIAAVLLAAPLYAQKQRDTNKSGYDNADRATVLHVANVYVTPDSATPPITTLGIGHEIVVSAHNGPWVNVFVNVDPPDDPDPNSAPEFEDPLTPSAGPSSGWIRDKGIVSPATPHGDTLLFGAAAELESQAAQPHPPIDAAPSAHRLYARVVDYFPNSPLAPEAAFRAADIRWQLDRADISTLPSAHEQAAYLRPQIYEGELRWVMKTYPQSDVAARAAFDLLDNKLCGDWQGLPQCPEQEAKLYLNYADRYRNGPKSAEALYLAAYRQGVLVTMYNVQENDRMAAAAAKNCQSIADELLHDYPKSDFAARAESIAFRVAQGIPITGSDRD